MSLNDYDKLKVVYVDVNDIKPAPFNPPSRSNAQSIESLEREIKDAGAVLVPLALTRNGELADGHGRLLIAKRLGFKTVPCIYYPTDNAKALYSRLNSATRPMQSRTWKEAHRHGLDEEYLPPRQRSQIAGLRRILPIDEFNQFMDHQTFI